MKLILLSITTILLSSSAFAADLSKLGSLNEYTCIVEVETRNSGGSYGVKQTCESHKSQFIGEISAAELGDKSQLLIQIIKTLREKGMHLVTQSNDVYDSTKANGKLMMTFQKRDIE